MGANNNISNGSISRFMYPQQEASVVRVCVRPDLLKILVRGGGCELIMDHGQDGCPFRSCEPSSCLCMQVASSSMGKASSILLVYRFS